MTALCVDASAVSVVGARWCRAGVRSSLLQQGGRAHVGSPKLVRWLAVRSVPLCSIRTAAFGLFPLCRTYVSRGYRSYIHSLPTDAHRPTARQQPSVLLHSRCSTCLAPCSFRHDPTTCRMLALASRSLSDDHLLLMLLPFCCHNSTWPQALLVWSPARTTPTAPTASACCPTSRLGRRTR